METRIGERQFVPGFPRSITWQGWAVVLGLLLAIVAEARYIGIATVLGLEF